MSFTLPGFLRRTPPVSLRRYFMARNFGLPDIDWDAVPKLLNRRLRAAIEGLAEDERDHTLDDFERVAQLCDDPGQMALQDVLAASDPAARRRLWNMEGNEARALEALLVDANAFDRALTTAYAARHRNGRTWSAFRLPAPLVLKHDGQSLKDLEADASALFRDFDGSGRTLKIEPFTRSGRNLGDSTETSFTHYTVYIEGLPETRLEFRGTEPLREARRPAVEAALWCDPERGFVEVVAKGGRPLREKLVRAFAQHLAGSDAGLEELRPRRFDLDRLARPIGFPVDAADGIQDVRLASLRLADAANRHGRITLEVDGADLHRTCADWFGASDPLHVLGWTVIGAELRITFRPEAEGKREKQITVKLTAPNWSNLKDHTRQHRLIAEKYLGRWGLTQAP